MMMMMMILISIIILSTYFAVSVWLRPRLIVHITIRC